MIRTNVWKPIAFASLLLAGSASLQAGSNVSGLVILHPTASGALTMSGNASIHIPAHAVYVNSNHNQAIKSSGQAVLDAPNVWVRGSAQFSGQAHCTGVIHRTSVEFEDPCGGIVLPTGSGMTSYGDRSISGGANVVLQPGLYGSISVSGNSTLTFAPGVHVISSNLSISSGCIIRGEGVTLIVRTGSVSISGQADLLLSPPKADDLPAGQKHLAGIVLAQPPTNANSMSLSGGSAFQLLGTIYVPNAELKLSGQGTVQGEGPLMGDLVVARTVTLSGLGSIRIGREGANQTAIELMQAPMYD